MNIDTDLRGRNLKSYKEIIEVHDKLHNYLAANGVGTIIHYPIAPHQQECYKEWNHLSLPITEYIANHELSLPIGPAISMEEVKKVVEIVNAFIP